MSDTAEGFVERLAGRFLDKLEWLKSARYARNPRGKLARIMEKVKHLGLSDPTEASVNKLVDTFLIATGALGPDQLGRLHSRWENFLDRLQLLVEEFGEESIDMESFDLDDWARLHGYVSTPYEASIMKVFVWSYVTLNARCPIHGGEIKVSQTHHALTTVDGLSIMGLQRLYAAKNGRIGFWDYEGECPYEHEVFANVPLKLGRYLLYKGAVPNSTWQTPEDQIAMLPRFYSLPPAPVEVARAILMLDKMGTFGVDSYAVRTADKNSKGEWVCVDGVGRNSCKIRITYCPDGNARPYIGIGAMREGELPKRGRPIFPTSF